MPSKLFQQILGPRTPSEDWVTHRMHYLWPSICLAGAAVLLIVSIFLPYWGLVLHAPQYPKGLAIVAYVNRLEGDVWEIERNII